MKPISTGPASEDDARTLKKRLKLKDQLKLINPVHYKKPLAPLATEIESRKWRVESGKLREENRKLISKAYRQLEKKHDLVLVEGIGGVLVPIWENYFVADLIKELELPALIVARAGLGTINHTLLTIEALKRRKVPILGLALNGFSGKELSEKSNARIIEKISGLPVLFQLSQISG